MTVGVLALALACGGEPKQATQESASTDRAQDFDPCSLLTREEISSAMSWTPDSSQHKWYGTTGNCTWFGPGSIPKTVALLVGQGMSDMSSSAAMAEWRAKQYKNSGITDAIVEPVEGLEVPAIRNELGGVAAVEMAIKGKLVTISSIADFAQVRALAQPVPARMP
jgi:hypothetical protein